MVVWVKEIYNFLVSKIWRFHCRIEGTCSQAFKLYNQYHPEHWTFVATLSQISWSINQLYGVILVATCSTLRKTATFFLFNSLTMVHSPSVDESTDYNFLVEVLNYKTAAHMSLEYMILSTMKFSVWSLSHKLEKRRGWTFMWPILAKL